MYSLAGRCDKSIPTRFLAPIECSKIPAQATNAGGIDPLESILGLLKGFKIRALFGFSLLSRQLEQSSSAGDTEGWQSKREHRYREPH
jgi:hypothetical protein